MMLLVYLLVLINTGTVVCGYILNMVYYVSDCLDCLGTWHCWHIEDGSHQQSHQLMMMSWLDNDVFFLADRFRQSSRQEVDNNETKRPQIFHHTNTTQNAKATLLLLQHKNKISTTQNHSTVQRTCLVQHQKP